MIDRVFEIKSNRLIADGIFEMTLQTQDLPDIAAGQFAEVTLPDRPDLILRRPFCLYSADKKSGTVKIGYALRGQGTKSLSQMKEGRQLNALLPLGNGFPQQFKNKKIMLTGGGVGVLPLLSVAQTFGGEIFSCIGFKDKSLVIKHDEFASLSKKCVVATDDGSYGEKGFVGQVAAKYVDDFCPDVIFACGPDVMLKSLKPLAKYPTFVSLEQRMGCGFGACLVCVCKIKRNGEEHNLRVCADGPVFPFGEVFYD